MRRTHVQGEQFLPDEVRLTPTSWVRERCCGDGVRIIGDGPPRASGWRMGELDLAAKVLLQVVPEDLVGLALPGVIVRGVRPADTNLPAFALTMDKLLRVELTESDTPLMLHFEVAANWASTVPRQTFDYWSLAHRAYDELWSVVICLKPGVKQGPPRGHYERRVRGRRPVSFEFDVIRLWELSADDALMGGKLGVLPFVPFMSGAGTDHVEQAMVMLARVEPVRRRGELQAALAAFADNVFPDVDWSDRMPEELLMGSSVYQRGEIAGQRKVLGVQLHERLGERAGPIVLRLQVASADALTHVAKLLAGRHTDEALLASLTEALSGGTPRSEAE